MGVKKLTESTTACVILGKCEKQNLTFFKKQNITFFITRQFDESGSISIIANISKDWGKKLIRISFREIERPPKFPTFRRTSLSSWGKHFQDVVRWFGRTTLASLLKKLIIPEPRQRCSAKKGVWKTGQLKCFVLFETVLDYSLYIKLGSLHASTFWRKVKFSSVIWHWFLREVDCRLFSFGALRRPSIWDGHLGFTTTGRGPGVTLSTPLSIKCHYHRDLSVHIEWACQLHGAIMAWRKLLHTGWASAA